MNSFFRTMVEEKGILENSFEVVHNGMTHFMEVGVVIELIESAPKQEQSKIKNTFSMIDFKNGDLMHYIKFLAEAFVKTNY